MDEDREEALGQRPSGDTGTKAVPSAKLHSDFDIVSRGPRTPLHEAAELGDTQTVKELLSGGADPNAPDGDGNTPLHLLLDHWPPVKTSDITSLLNAGADVNAVNQQGKTPIFVALPSTNTRQAVEVLRLLLDAGANTNVTYDGDGNTLLHFAVFHSAPATVVKVLCDNGADCHAVNRAGRTPEQLALNRGEYRMADTLRKAAAKQDAHARDR